MLNMLRMDLRRMAQSKMFYIAFGAMVAGVILTVVLLHIVTDPDARAGAMRMGMVFTEEDGAVIDDIVQMTFTEALCSTVYTGGVLFLALYIVSVLFVCSDFNSGFAKNIFSVQSARWPYFVSKVLCMAVVCGIWMAGTAIVFKVSCAVVDLRFLGTGTFPAAAFVCGFGLVGIAFCAQGIFLSVLTRSEGAGIAAAIVLPGGIVVSLLESLLGLWGISILDRTLYGCVQGVAMHLDARGPLAPYLVTAVVWLAVWTFGAIVVLKRRDI